MEKLSTTKVQSWLLWFLRGLLILGYFVLLGRLADLQLIRGEYYKVLAEGNRIRRVPIVAARGRILSRGGEVLVGNRKIKKRVLFEPEEGYLKSQDIQGASEEEIITEWERDYLFDSQLAHISGYLGEVDEEEVGKIRARCPGKGPRRIGSYTGRNGLEQQYDCTLAGIDGEELVEVDSRGSRVRTLGRKEPLDGTDIKTTIDIGLQQRIAKLISEEAEMPTGRRGAVIVTDLKGEVLALYSSPSYDPNAFIESDTEYVTEILNDESLPLFSRVIGGRYHPGSTYKPVVAIAALEEEKIDEHFTYEDTGKITIKTIYGDFSYANWYFTQYGGTEGEINLERAITRSTDTFFYKIGELVGIDKLHKWSGKFGLDKPTGIDIPGEVAGLIPSRKWKEDVKGERWFLGNTYHMSIGQGDIALTPIALNSAISAIANNGDYCPPHIKDLNGLSGSRCRSIGIDEKSINLVNKGMIGACKSGGTGYTFFDFSEKYGFDVACKTGTAETDDVSEDTHAWFTAFTPDFMDWDEELEGKEIVVTVLVEKGGEGSKVAGPIARKIFDYWFKGEESTQE
jgi:penicillin-binding protein 2